MNEKMSWILISAVTIVIIGLLIVIDWIAQPPPDPGPGPRVSADVVKANIKGNLDEIVCDFAKGAGANGNSQSAWVFSEDDGDKEAKRSGSAPLLCDKQRLGIVIVRQYCRNSGSSTQWNNEIEEIDFPKYTGIWLSDDLYAGLANPGSFAPPPELL